MGKKDANKPRGRMSAYAFFVQTCREEHKEKHPGESVVFAEFSKKCSQKWKAITPKEKKRFEDMAGKDKARYEKEMDSYVPPEGEKKRKMKTKDPNAPKRPLSAFFCFCAEERPKVRAGNPGWSVGLVAKELGKKWEVVPSKTKYEKQAAEDKARYERELAAYKSGLGSPKKAKPSPKAAAVVEEDDDDEEDDEEDEEDDDEESDDE